MARPPWLEGLVLPLLMFPFLRDCRFGDDHGADKGRRLSERHGNGAMGTLEGLPAAFGAFLQARRGSLERGGISRQGYAMLSFFLRYNAAHSWWLLFHTILYILLRVLYLLAYDQYMAALNLDDEMLLMPYNDAVLWTLTTVFCLLTLATNLQTYVTCLSFWRFGTKAREQAIYLVNHQVLHASQFDLDSHASAGQLVGMVGADARQFEYVYSFYRLLSVPFDVITVVILLWRNMEHEWVPVIITLLPAIALLAVQPWLNRLFSSGLRKAAGLRATRLNISRDGLVNYLPTKLFGAQHVLLDKAHAERKKEERALKNGFFSYGFLAACQIWGPPFITQIAAALSFHKEVPLSATEVFAVLGYAKLITSDALYNLNFSMAMISSILHTSSKMLQLVLKTTPSNVPGSNKRSGAAAGKTCDGQSSATSSKASSDGDAPSLPNAGPPAPVGFSLRGFEVWWPKAEAPAVRVPALDVAPGQLVAVYGGVGSGKSTLLLGLLGELHLGEGAASEPAPLAGTPVAYAPQTPVILQDTIQANILFGLEEDAQRLRAAVHAAGFSEDVARFELGLATPVAEKGTSLSGGQRIRLGLARCAYAALSGRVGAVLLDDPLAGVDPEKARLIFQRTIARGGALTGLTRLVAVSDPALLPQFDTVLDLSDGATISKKILQTAAEPPSVAAPLAAAGSPPVAVAAQEPAPEPATEEPEWLGDLDVDDVLDSEPLAVGAGAGLLQRTWAVRVEVDKKGAVRGLHGRSWNDQGADADAPAPMDNAAVDRSAGFKQWGLLVRAMGLRVTAIICSGLALTVGCLIAWQLMTRDWLDAFYGGTKFELYRLLSNVFGFGMAVIGTAAVMLQTAALIKGSTCCLRAALAGALAAPYSFFQANPSSRILSRLSDDQRRVDEQLTKSFMGCVVILALTLASLFMTAFSLPYMIAAIVPALAFLQYLRTKFVGASKALRHEEAATSSCTVTASTEALEGAAVARAFRQQDLLLRRLRGRQEAHVMWNDGLTHVNGWLLYACNVLVYCPLAIAATLMASCMLAEDPGSSAGATLISNVFQIASLIYALSATLCGVEAQLTAMERVVELSELEPEEVAVRRLPEGGEPAGHAPTSAAAPAGGKAWPSAGEIEFRDTTAAYHWGADPALTRLSLAIPQGTSCVLMGHSGSGKSTALLALTGLIPVLSGDIQIDERSTLAVSLGTLRDGMAVVPQEPMLFRGSVRFNLDLLGGHPDAQLWEALQMVAPSLAGAVRELGGLDAWLDPQKPVISKGQMQLLCLARAILRDAPILLLDESNASVDAETDSLMEEFVSRFAAGREGLTRRRRTLVQVSHKATGLRSRDRIVVLEAGQVVEQGAPAELLQRPDGRFAAMLRTLEGGAA